MLTNNKFRAVLLGCAAVALLGACSGSDGVASPGVGAFVPPPAAPPPPAPPPPAPPPPTGGPAADCPSAEYTNIGIVADQRICELPSTIIGNLVVPKRDGTIYSIAGQTRVGRDLGADPANQLSTGARGVLTIEAGVTLFGNSGLDFLVVNRGSQIFAEGTADDPIIMTSRQSVEGTTTENSIGQWGGLLINGRAPTSDCPSGVLPPSLDCASAVEGADALYGGLTETDNSGRIRYLRVMHSGFTIAPNNELNGITFAGVGNGTVAEFIQVHNSSDDGIEIFGGTVNLKNIVLTGSDDDSFDTDSGWRGAAQFGIVYQRTGGGDYGFETSSRGNNTATFFTRPVYANWTINARSLNTTSSSQSRAPILHNSGHVGQVFNSVLTANNTNVCLEIAGASTLTNGNAFSGTGPYYRSVHLSCDAGPVLGNAPVTNANVEAIIDADPNSVKAGTSSLANGFINGPSESAVPAATIPAGSLPASVRNFLTPVTYIGAVRDVNDTWYQGWTCGLPTTPSCN